MAHGNSLRPALTVLPVNTSASPRRMSSSKEIPTSMKRHVHEIDDPEYPLASTSSCAHSGKILRGHFPEEGLRPLQEVRS